MTDTDCNNGTIWHLAAVKRYAPALMSHVSGEQARVVSGAFWCSIDFYEAHKAELDEAHDRYFEDMESQGVVMRIPRDEP